jgi:hypothetical protein
MVFVPLVGNQTHTSAAEKTSTEKQGINFP